MKLDANFALTLKTNSFFIRTTRFDRKKKESDVAIRFTILLSIETQKTVITTILTIMNRKL